MISASRRSGLALVALSATSFGVMPVLTKVVYRDGADPVGVLAVRFTIAGLLLLALARWRGERLPRGRQLVALILLGGVGYVVESLAYFLALTRAPAGLVALLLYTYPALVVVLTAVVLRRRPGLTTAACLAGALVGTALTIGPVQSGQGVGVLLGLGAAASYATYIVVSSRWIGGLGPLAVAAVVMTAAGVVDDLLAIALRPALPSSASGWLALLTVAAICTVVAVTAFFAGLRLLGPAETSIVSTLEPVVSVGLGAAVLGEHLGTLQLMGGAVVVTAVVVLARLGESPAGEPA